MQGRDAPLGVKGETTFFVLDIFEVEAQSQSEVGEWVCTPQQPSPGSTPVITIILGEGVTLIACGVKPVFSVPLCASKGFARSL